MSLSPINDFLETAVEEGVFPGADLLVGLGETVLLHNKYGSATLVPEQEPLLNNTIFDLASLTKPLATTLGIMALAEGGRLTLDRPFHPKEYPFLNPKISGMTVRHLLAHSSGLPAYQPYFERLENETGIKKVILQDWIRREPETVQPGTRTEYSDLGFMALDWIFSEITGEDLDGWLRKNIYLPLGLTRLGFRPISISGVPDPGRYAPTENCPWRRKILRGEVHDENAYALGGISGQAGLFGTAFEIFKLIRTLKKAYDQPRGSHLFNGKLVRQFWTRQTLPLNTSRALGFDTPSETDSSAGRFFSRLSVGHLGFTGTSFWLDLEKDLLIILLTNRVHPTRANQKIKTFRPLVHDLIYQQVSSLKI
ncbi:MAG TPA: serine hydrolase domain-containing protein [Thermodesulfobacteriota bacterium]|nr:serine hydrolase domain-containing protein [Thermodesulfobacteriota bacterium]